jgi:hypothetical protein
MEVAAQCPVDLRLSRDTAAADHRRCDTDGA